MKLFEIWPLPDSKTSLFKSIAKLSDWNVDSFTNHKLFIHAFAFIADVYEYDTFPFKDDVTKSNINMNEENKEH